MKFTLCQVNAALMPLQVVQSKQQIDFIVLEDCERTLYSVTWAPRVRILNVHVSKMNSAQNFCATHSDCSALKSRV